MLVVTAIYTVGALCAAKMCPDEIAIPTQTTKCSITVRNLPVSTFVHKGRLHYCSSVKKETSADIRRFLLGPSVGSTLSPTDRSANVNSALVAHTL